jgi:hypothetical protein
VPGATESVIGADIGVSLVIYDLVTDGEGATVEIDPPLSGTMNPGDVMELWLLGETTFLYSKIIEDENAITTLRIPKGRLHADRINELFYIIKRGSDNIGTSPMLTMLYNKIRPGLKDRFPNEEGHSELELLLPDAIKNGVGPDFVSAQVCVSYPYCRAYDTITLKCNGESMHFIVGRDEAPEPPDPGSPIATRVCFTVTRAHLEVAQRPDHELNFSYTVTDQLGNVPDTDAVWSATQTVEEDLAGTRLPAAILREILSEADDESGTIDLGKLGAYLYVIILVRDPRFEVGDFIEATYTGQSPGLPDVVMTVGGNVQADEFGDPVRVVLEIPNDKVVSVQTVSVAYVLKRNGEQKYSSREAKARVIGEAVTVPPVIDRVTDSKGEIDNGGTTIETSITITGSASVGQKVQLYDGDAPIGGELTAVGGIWTATISVAVGVRSLTAKALYGSGQVSAAWVVNVTAVVAPTITSVKDAKNVEVPHNGFTVETSVTLTGTASKGQKVQILDGTTVKGEPVADAATGIWTLVVTALDVAEHHFTAKALYGSGQVSTVWTFTVVVPLSFGADVTLNLPSYSVVRGIPPINPPDDATYTRVGTGGVPPYTYSSASNNVATIDAAGKVRVAGRGTTTLKVTDSKGASVTHKITVTGVIMFMRIGSLMNQFDAERACIAQGGGLPINRAQLRAVYDTYVGQTGGIVQAAGWLHNATWTHEPHSQINHSWTVVMSNGQYSFAHATQGPSAVACRIDTTPAPTTEELGGTELGADISD